ncbi:unnamed protein product, partial [Heterosigma akashiwo]
VQKFVQFLKIRSISGEGPQSGAYKECIDFLLAYSEEIGLDHELVEPVEGKPILILKWEGTDPSLPCIVLNSHYDVVPCEADRWTHDPFGGHIDAEGRIFGRGAQDMKSVCVQYLEAVRRLRARGFAPRRTVRLTFMPDEELGGEDGMVRFLASPAWARMAPVGLVLDEGLASRDAASLRFHGEARGLVVAARARWAGSRRPGAERWRGFCAWRYSSGGSRRRGVRRADLARAGPGGDGRVAGPLVRGSGRRVRLAARGVGDAPDGAPPGESGLAEPLVAPVCGSGGDARAGEPRGVSLGRIAFSRRWRAWPPSGS